MSDNILSARNSAARFLAQRGSDDEYFLITFNDRTTLAQDYTSSAKTVQNNVAFNETKGRTALYDAIYAGLEKMRDAQHDKKALIVITDGEDNSSLYTFSEVKDFAKESGVQVYVIAERGDQG